jgi:hypothetical protein
MSLPQVPLLGRDEEIGVLERLLRDGQVVVLRGRVGAGKSALLRSLACRASRRGIPNALAARTTSLADFTEALAVAYPGTEPRGTQRQRRSRLRTALAARPGVLLLDHLGRTGTAFKGAIRSVRGTGLGIVFAADVDHLRDHERVRALGLSHHELELRPLHGRSMRALLQAFVRLRRPAFPLTPEHVRSLVAATEGLPGRAVDFVEALADPAAWSRGNPRVDWLRTGSAIRAAEQYRLPMGSA